MIAAELIILTSVNPWGGRLTSADVNMRASECETDSELNRLNGTGVRNIVSL
jgi:hypothetical protein